MKKSFSLLLVLALAVTSMLVFTSCGKDDTLEAYVKDNEEVAKVFKSMESEDDNGSVKVHVKDNKIIIVSKYSDKMSDAAIKNFKKNKRKNEDKMKETFQNLIASLEKNTKIKGITVDVNYHDGGGKEIYSQTYKGVSEEK